MNVTLIENLVVLSRPPRPSTWQATLAPLARRAEVVTLRRAAQAVEHERLSNLLALLNMKKLNFVLTTDGAINVGLLVALGQELRLLLDSPPIDLRDSVRAMVSATVEHEYEFVAAAQKVNQLLPLAEAAIERIDTLVARVGVVTERLTDTNFISEKLVIPPTSGEQFLHDSTTSPATPAAFPSTAQKGA
jgi:hypothetical protein